MILRFKTSDNADAWYVSEFCKDLRDRMFIMEEDVPFRKDYESDRKWSDAVIKFWEEEKNLEYKRVSLMDPKRHFVKNSKAYKEVIAEVSRKWKEFAKPRNLICATPSIDIQYNLEETDENGEVVYYFTAINQSIIQ